LHRELEVVVALVGVVLVLCATALAPAPTGTAALSPLGANKASARSASERSPIFSLQPSASAASRISPSVESGLMLPPMASSTARRCSVSRCC
jgi:hypothetical protein